MDQILREVARARRRLWMELFLKRLVRCWTVAFLAAAAVLAVPKIVAIEQVPLPWDMGWLLGAAGAGIVAALVWTLIRGQSELDAAIEIDRRFGLKERVATSLSLSREASETPAGQALLRDVQHRLEKVDVGERIRVGVPRRGWLPLASALVACVVVFSLDNKVAQSRVEPSTVDLSDEERENVAEMRRKLAERRKKAEEAGLEDAEKLFRELEEKAEELANKKKTPDRKEAMVKLNDLAKELEKRREQLGGEEQLRKQLEKMKNLNRGPAEKMLDAMKKGDWQAARQELKKLQQQLANNQLNADQKAALEKQMEQLAEQLTKAAEQQKQRAEELKQQIEQQKQQGNLAEAGRLQEKLDQLAREGQQQQMQQLAAQLAQCQSCMKQGDSQGAMQAMQAMAAQMAAIEQQMAESQLLDAAMNQLQQAKSSLACSQCKGGGCSACQGSGGNQPGNRDWAQGQGPGGGRRADEENDVRFRDSQVRQKPQQGDAVLVGEVEGPNIRGEVAEQIKQEMAADAVEPSDPLVIEQLPKSRRDHAEEYFNTLREGR